MIRGIDIILIKLPIQQTPTCDIRNSCFDLIRSH